VLWSAVTVAATHSLLLSTAARAALGRALGLPGVESTANAVNFASNIVLTLVLGPLLGLYGVLIATVVAAAVGLIVFRRTWRSKLATRVYAMGHNAWAPQGIMVATLGVVLAVSVASPHGALASVIGTAVVIATFARTALVARQLNT
jgi:O-antigen/teichoic acid export membrane protein